jgi:hypothetical protein
MELSNSGVHDWHNGDVLVYPTACRNVEFGIGDQGHSEEMRFLEPHYFINLEYLIQIKTKES